RPPRAGPYSAWRSTWPTPAWGCGAMGWCSAWGGGGMGQPRHHATAAPEAMVMKIFVGNLCFTTTGQELRACFEAYETVETVRIMTDRDTGRPRGFGFVEMPNGSEAQAAITGLNGTSLGGRPLTVNAARQRAEHGGPRRPRDERRPRW